LSKWRAWLIWLLALAALPSLVPNPYVQYVVNLSLIFAFATIGMNIIFGYAGQHAFGHPVFFGVGAYASALLSIDAAWPIGLAIPAGALITASLAVVIGLPLFRLRGIFFGMATIAFAYVVYIIAQTWIDLTRGPMGIPSVPLLWPLPAGNALGLGRDMQARTLAIASIGAIIWMLTRLLQAPMGRAWIAIRENERLATSVGIAPLRYKMTAFVLSAAISGIGGGYYAHYVGFISPTELEFHFIGVILIMLIAGGAGTLAGPLIGAVVFGILPELLRVAETARDLLLGIILLLCIAVLPEGLVGIWHRLRAMYLARPTQSRSVTVTPGASPAGAENPAPALRSRDAGGVLELRGVSKTFDGLRALSNVSFMVQPGEVVGLIGPNGAGKTTLFNVITGFIAPNSGVILYRGQTISGLPPHLVAASGIARTFQITSLFSELTVADNVRIGTHLWSCRNPLAALLRTPAFRAAERAVDTAVEERLALVGLTEQRDVFASALSYGEQRRLEVAVALASGASMVLLDEPAAGLNAEETEQLCALVRRLKRSHYSVVVIEHDIHLVMSICERIIVLNYGCNIFSGTPDAATADAGVIEAYLGPSASHA
jgi:branched-chain amino acid transport system permease protein